MGHTTPINWLVKFCKKEELKYITVHGFRHTNASLLISGGTDIKTVSASLGHSNATTTLNMYAHTFAAAQAQASEAVAALLRHNKEKTA